MPATGRDPAARARSSRGATSTSRVLETARGGIVLRGVGYESNDASVLTNVSSDHLDLQGIHTLPELAEVKSVDRPDHEARRLGRAQRRRPARRGGARRVRGHVALFSTVDGRHRAVVRRHVPAGGRGYVSCATAGSSSSTGDTRAADRRGRRASRSRIGGLARHNVANALAAAGGGARPGRHARAGPRRAASTSGRRRSARRAGSTCSGSARGS